jgi:hypothetical protein
MAMIRRLQQPLPEFKKLDPGFLLRDHGRRSAAAGEKPVSTSGGDEVRALIGKRAPESGGVVLRDYISQGSFGR